MNEVHPLIVAVSGLSSNTGKTTLVCDLLEHLHGWEAIKITRGHYRSCGKDPSGCCVSDLLRDQPLIRSGREANYEKGKDTGRFWDAGAENVHWVIVGEDQVEAGIKEALSRVRAPAVIVEGNSFLDYVETDLAIICARAGENKLKTSARRTLAKADAIYLSTLEPCSPREAVARFNRWRWGLTVDLPTEGLQTFSRAQLPQLIERIHRVLSQRDSMVPAPQ